MKNVIKEIFTTITDAYVAVVIMLILSIIKLFVIGCCSMLPMLFLQIFHSYLINMHAFVSLATLLYGFLLVIRLYYLQQNK